jgi:hypothetical protein
MSPAVSLPVRLIRRILLEAQPLNDREKLTMVRRLAPILLASREDSPLM